MPSPSPRLRYRFGPFVLSPARRQLLRGGVEVSLIPRYFDLLRLLIERRQEAVTRRDMLDAVWSDVVVSDGALSQAVRSLRRALGDDSREAVFIRTVSRHGYRWAFDDVLEEPDEAALPSAREGAAAEAAPPQSGPVGGEAPPAPVDPFEPLLERLLARNGNGEEADDERQAAAEALHALGTAEVLRRLDRRPGHALARALLREARWDVPSAGPVPILGEPGALSALFSLVRLRLRRACRLAGRKVEAAALGGGLAGLAGGVAGGLALVLAPTSGVPAHVPVVLGLVGVGLGAAGATGVGAGLAAAEALARSSRGVALAALGAAGGGLVGLVWSLLARWGMGALFGREVEGMGGGFEGVVLGAAAGVAYAIAVPRPGGGLATPRGTERARAVAAMAVGCALAGVALTWLGGHLAAVSLHDLARAFQGSQVGMGPLARLLGERELGPLTRSVLGAFEGLLFGIGLAIGLTRRPRA